MPRMGTSGGWIARVSLSQTYDRKPRTGDDDPYYGTDSFGRTVTGRPCFYVGSVVSAKDWRAITSVTAGPALLIEAGDPLKEGDQVANIREGDVLWLEGPVEVLSVQPVSAFMRVATLQGATR
jgi:hypothetical protein